MNFLFIHQSFPAQYWRVVAWLRDRGHHVTFVTTPNDNAMLNVRKVEYAFDAAVNPTTFEPARDFEVALRRAETVARVAGDLAKAGFRPDMVIGHHGWGELLNIHDVWPNIPLLGYFEFYYHPKGFEVGFDPEFVTPPGREARVRAKNAINHQALINGGLGQTPTRFQHLTYPEIFRSRIKVIEEGVDLDACAPDPAAANQNLALDSMSLDPKINAALAGVAIQPGQKLVTFVNRTLEPVRGFHIMMRALPKLLARADVQVVFVGRDSEGYGPALEGGITWKTHFQRELAGAYDPGRVHFVGNVHYASYVKLLQRADAHVYLTYPFVLSWSLREALACGCAIVASDTAPVREFVHDGHNGLLTPFFDAPGLAAQILRLLEDQALNATLRRHARDRALETLSLARTLQTYRDTIESLTGQFMPV